jgi:flagellar biosynthesis/type III secretory pathway protein FliH
MGRTAGKIEKGATKTSEKIEDATDAAGRRIERLEHDFQKGYEEGRK